MFIKDVQKAAEADYDKEYSKGKYCHRDSFVWGYQEGFQAALRNVSDKQGETGGHRKDFEVSWFGF